MVIVVVKIALIDLYQKNIRVSEGRLKSCASLTASRKSAMKLAYKPDTSPPYFGAHTSHKE